MKPKIDQRFGLRTPCDNCPFRSDITFHLNPERVLEIQEGLERGTFDCHKTVHHNNGGEWAEEGDYIASGNEVHCAGALILLEKLEQPSQMMRIAERLGMYDRRKLDMNAHVFDTFEEMYDRMVDLEGGAKPKRKRARGL